VPNILLLLVLFQLGPSAFAAEVTPSPSPTPSARPSVAPSAPLQAEEEWHDSVLAAPEDEYRNAAYEAEKRFKKNLKEQADQLEKDMPEPLNQRVRALNAKIAELDLPLDQMVVSIDGADTIDATLPNGKTAKLGAYSFLPESSVIRTSHHVCAVLAFEDLSLIIVSGDSEISLKIDKSKGGAIPLVMLKKGEARVLVQKQEGQEDLRLKVRAPSIVLGAKEGDFLLLSVDDDWAAYALHSNIRYAKSEELLTKDGQDLEEGNFVRSLASKKAVEKKDKFKAYKVIALLSDRYPGMKRLHKFALRPSFRRKITERYESTRQERAEKKALYEQKKTAFIKKYYPLFRGPEAERLAKKRAEDRTAKLKARLESNQKVSDTSKRRQKRFELGEPPPEDSAKVQDILPSSKTK
jgi:hypothetical protein